MTANTVSDTEHKPKELTVWVLAEALYDIFSYGVGVLGKLLGKPRK